MTSSHFADLPLFVRVGPGAGRKMVLRGARSTTTLAEIMALAGLDRLPVGVALDGRVHHPATELGRVAIRAGSEIAAATAGPRHPPVPVVTAIAMTGPDWGRVYELAPGRHPVGRSAAAACRIDDPVIAPHHAVLAVSGSGRITPTGLGLGRPLETTSEGLIVGSTGLRLSVPDQLPDLPDPGVGDGRLPVVRAVQPARPTRPVLSVPPRDPSVDHRPSGIGLFSTGVAVSGGIVAGLILRQPTMILLSILAALGTVATSGIQAARARRTRRTRIRHDAEARARFAAELAAEAAWMRAALELRIPWTVGDRGVRIRNLWDERAAPGCVWSPVLGRGDVAWEPVVEGGAADPVVLTGVGVPIDLPLGAVVAVTGPPDPVARLSRSLVLQAACRFGPADLRILGDVDDEVAPWLPHRDAGANPSDDRRVALMVLRSARALTVRTSEVRRWLDREGAQAWTIVEVEADEVVPRVCTHVVTVHHGGTGTVEVVAEAHAGRFLRTGSVQRFTTCGLGAESAARIARHLAGWADPEALASALRVAPAVTLDQVTNSLPRSAVEIEAAWARAGRDPAPIALIGQAADGPVEVDLRRDGPHALVAGTTGAGKSELLRTVVLSLALTSPPELLQFVLVDYKGGSAFDACRSLPHVAGMVTDLDERLGARMLMSLDAELHRRERQFRAMGAADLDGYRAGGGEGPAPRLVVIVDEFAALAAELPTFLSSLVSIAQRGRSLGVHLILATQRPAGVVNDDIRANTNVRICLRVQDPADAHDVIGDRRPAELPRAHPGRAMIRFGSDPPVTFQTARVTAPTEGRVCGPVLIDHGPGHLPGVRVEPGSTPSLLDATVEAAIEAAARRPRPEGPRPWCDPLPNVLLTDVGELGAIDDVVGQCRRPLEWTTGSGHLLVAGMLGAGVSTAIARVVLAAAHREPPDALHIYVVDGDGGGDWSAVEELPHCGGVIGGDDIDRLARLCSVLDRGRVGFHPSPRGPRTLVVIDGVDALRARLSGSESIEVADRLERLVVEGPRQGVTIVFGIDHPGSLPFAWAGRCARRWVGKLADPVDAATLGVPMGSVLRSGPPGRFVVEDGDGGWHDAQVGALEPDLATAARPIARRWCDRTPTVVTVGPNPTVLGLGDISPGRSERGATIVPIGERLLELGPAEVPLHRGDHVIVLGPPRSGRSAALQLIREQWAGAVPHGTVVELIGRSRSGERPGAVTVADAVRVIDSGDRGAPVLIIADDVERVDDESGGLARLIAEDRAGLHIVAASRGDALRALGYGHWTAAIRGSAHGLLLGSFQDSDADVLGRSVPRRLVPRRLVAPGRGVLVAAGRIEPIQLAWPGGGESQRGLAVAGSTGHECFG